MPRPDWRHAVDLGSSLLTIAAAATLLWRLTGPHGPPTNADVASAAVALPDRIALTTADWSSTQTPKVALVAYSDFRCKFCGDFARTTLPSLRKTYFDSGRVAFAFRHMPWDDADTDAMSASSVALCAADYGRFWEVHDWLFARSDELGRAIGGATSIAESSGGQKTAQCIADAPARVRQHASEGRRFGVLGTPTFFAGIVRDRTVEVRSRIVGAQPTDYFVSVLNDLIYVADQESRATQ